LLNPTPQTLLITNSSALKEHNPSRKSAEDLAAEYRNLIGPHPLEQDSDYRRQMTEQKRQNLDENHEASGGTPQK